MGLGPKETNKLKRTNNNSVPVSDPLARATKDCTSVTVIQDDSTWIISSAGLRLGSNVNDDSPLIHRKPKPPSSFGQSILDSARCTARKLRFTRMITNEAKRKPIHIGV